LLYQVLIDRSPELLIHAVSIWRARKLAKALFANMT
jgi:hypothetical protein